VEGSSLGADGELPRRAETAAGSPSISLATTFAIPLEAPPAILLASVSEFKLRPSFFVTFVEYGSTAIAASTLILKRKFNLDALATCNRSHG
jgi:hypothetical protein